MHLGIGQPQHGYNDGSGEGGPENAMAEEEWRGEGGIKMLEQKENAPVKMRRWNVKIGLAALIPGG